MALTMAEVTANRDPEYWIDRLSYAEPLGEAEQLALDEWLESPVGRIWAEGY